jgi:hypothetical protein
MMRRLSDKIRHMPNKPKKRARISVQVPAILRAAIARAAAADMRTPSSWVVRTLAAAVTEKGAR